jgi:hypothetical protein
MNGPSHYSLSRYHFLHCVYIHPSSRSSLVLPISEQKIEMFVVQSLVVLFSLVYIFYMMSNYRYASIIKMFYGHYLVFASPSCIVGSPEVLYLDVEHDALFSSSSSYQNFLEAKNLFDHFSFQFTQFYLMHLANQFFQ